MRELGVSFGELRSLVRMRAALQRLAQGAGVSAVANEVGYDSTSMFVARFRRIFGLTPGKYASRHFDIG